MTLAEGSIPGKLRPSDNEGKGGCRVGGAGRSSDEGIEPKKISEFRFGK